MSESPDKRLWLFFGPVFALAFLVLALPLDDFLEHLIETLLYAYCTLGAALIGVLSVRDGYSWCRPSTTRDEWPILFWMDVGLGCFLFSAMGGWKTFKMLATFP